MLWLILTLFVSILFVIGMTRRRFAQTDARLAQIEARVAKVDDQYSSTRATVDAQIRKTFDLDSLRGMQVQELVSNQRSLVTIVNALVTGEQITLEQLGEMTTTTSIPKGT